MTTSSQSEWTDFAALVDQAIFARTNYEAAKQRHERCQAEVALAMTDAGHKTTMARTPDGTLYKVTYVAAERAVFDEPGLRKALGAKVYDKLCAKPKLDRVKVDSAVRAGTLDATILAQHVTIETNRASIRYSIFKEGEDDE